jgi:selenocysteine lyase/cysteine desulfurase
LYVQRGANRTENFQPAERLTLDLILLDNLIDENTKLVAVTLASNFVGAITDVERIAKREK